MVETIFKKYMGKAMKKIITIIILILAYQFIAKADYKLLIDHHCIDLAEIPAEWVQATRADIKIGYGHTSHGSQLTAGMTAIENYFTDGTYEWGHSDHDGQVSIIEGGDLVKDCGYAGWDDATRTFINNHPGYNIIIWSWCGQVNSVDLQTHYLQNMAALEAEYPNIQFVYMTGHLEGQGIGGSLYNANQEIREFCSANNKILFDFADIEKYDPDGEVNYQEQNCDDACNYGSGRNWANEWMASNPEHLLTKIAQECGSCAHSVSLNCVKKGIASWHLWAKLAGWGGEVGINEEQKDIKIYPNPNDDFIKVANFTGEAIIYNLFGEKIWEGEVSENIKIDISNFYTGTYFIKLKDEVYKFYKI